MRTRLRIAPPLPDGPTRLLPNRFLHFTGYCAERLCGRPEFGIEPARQFRRFIKWSRKFLGGRRADRLDGSSHCRD